LQFNIPYDDINSSNIFVVTSLANLDRHKVNQTIETEVEQGNSSIYLHTFKNTVYPNFLLISFSAILFNKVKKEEVFKRMMKDIIC
jgi:hypothetical protein